MNEKKRTSYFVTGGAGFIGSNFINYILNKYKQNVTIVNYDLLTYAGNLSNLAAAENYPNYKFIKGDIADSVAVNEALKKYEIDYIINFAAESHVDRSIIDSTPFIRTNIMGTQVLLDSALKYGVKTFLQVSTDEVYGSLSAKGYFTETSPLAPSSPYSASKTSADLLALAAFKTHKLPVIITRCSNNYGPYQFPEKLIPLMIANVINKKPLPVYGKGENIRDWLYVSDHCQAIDMALKNGRHGEIYNIGGNNELKNIDAINLIIDTLEKKGYHGGRKLITFVADRPGHDLRYAIDSSKIRSELGFAPSLNFDEGIKKTIDWYIENTVWWQNIISGEYSAYYEKLYKPKFNIKTDAKS